MEAVLLEKLIFLKINICLLLWNTKVHCHAHKSPPLVPVPRSHKSFICISIFVENFWIVRKKLSWYLVYSMLHNSFYCFLYTNCRNFHYMAKPWIPVSTSKLQPVSSYKFFFFRLCVDTLYIRRAGVVCCECWVVSVELHYALRTFKWGVGHQPLWI
jgi:hypothetical protein